MPAPAASESAITRALSAASAAGLQVTRFSVARDGTVTVETKPKALEPEAKSVDTPAANVRPLEPKAWAKRG